MPLMSNVSPLLLQKRPMAAVDKSLVSFRAATPEDVPFLVALRHQTMVPHQVASGAVPSEAEVTNRVLVRYESAQIVLIEGQPVGLLKAPRDGLQWEVLQVQLSSQWQGQGLGTLLLQRIIGEAQSAGATLRLSVLKANPARRLYERLGFAIVEEREHAYTMQLGG
jgi:ribosomal protein S18 acetylase RimI-like enzyme